MTDVRRVPGDVPGRPERAATTQQFITLILINLAMLGIAYWRTAPASPGFFAEPFDHHKYIYIAVHGPLAFHIAPFCWRFLHPWIAGLLPWGLDRNFLILTLAETFLTGILVYYIARAAGFSHAVALTATIVYYTLDQAARASLVVYWGVDQASRVFAFLGFLLLLKRRPALASLAFAAGVCAKETLVIAAPLYYAWYAEKLIDFRVVRRAVLFALPIVATFLAVRYFIPAWNARPEYVSSLPYNVTQVYNGQAAFGYAELMRAMILDKLHVPVRHFVAACTVYAFGIFTVLPFFAIQKNLVPALRFSMFIGLTYLAMVFSGSVDRVLLIAFPLVAILALNGIGEITRKTGAPEALFTAMAVGLFVITAGREVRSTHFGWQFMLFAAVLAIAKMWRWGSFAIAGRGSASAEAR